MQKSWRSLKLLLLTTSIMVSGCISIRDLNERLMRIDRLWQLEYQRTEDEYRYRIVEAEYPTAFQAVRMAFLDMGLPIKRLSVTEGVIVSENNGPTPLTKEEWLEVVKNEEPRVKELGGWMFTMPEDASV